MKILESSPGHPCKDDVPRSQSKREGGENPQKEKENSNDHKVDREKLIASLDRSVGGLHEVKGGKEGRDDLQGDTRPMTSEAVFPEGKHADEWDDESQHAALQGVATENKDDKKKPKYQGPRGRACLECKMSKVRGKRRTGLIA